MNEFKLEAFSAEEDILNKGLGRNMPNIFHSSGNTFSIGGTSLDPSTSHSIWNISNWNPMGSGGGGDGGGGAVESGGLSEEDLAMKKRIYGKLEGLMDRQYNPYTGDTQTDRSPEELALIKEMQGGADFDTARKNLGFTSDAFKRGAEYGVGDLDRDASQLMGAGSTYRDQVADTTMRQMREQASKQGMINRGRQIGGGAAFGDRSYLQDSLNNQNYLSAAGDQLGKMNMSAYRESLDRARGLNIDRQSAAGRYGNTVMQDLGIGRQGQASRSGAFQQDRSYKDKDLSTLKKRHDARENYPYKNLAFASGIYSGMPFDEKVVTNEPASGGK